MDADTAAYPWELLMDGDEPLCTRMGMVRQLQTAHFRSHIRATTAQTAYVVGDPIVSPPYKQLAGARAEARAVNDLLKTRFETTYAAEPQSALGVLGGLYERPYRIVHLAGHGQYESPTTGSGKARSGMVLDNGVFLTAVEIGQMQQVPELVFLNCCHIGQTGPDAPPGVSATEFNRLAASISRELIEMGVRAVVAAGWAVRDDAALHFAQGFYQHMLDGDTFGTALQQARYQTWRQPQFRDCNTWGAYQAYGDPDFRFDPAGASASRGDGAYVAPDELIDVLAGFRREARDVERTGGDPGRSREATAKRLDALVKGCPAEWLERSDVAMEVGYTYGELRRFEDAARYLVLALEAEALEADAGSSATLRAVEQLSNYEARLAEGITGEGAVEQSVQALKASIGRLQRLLDVAKTSERYSLLGSAYKRLAAVDDDVAAAKESLRRAAESYESAHTWNLGRGRFNPYPVVNWLSCKALLGETVPDSETVLARIEAAARERFTVTREFFDAVAIPDSEMFRAVATGALADAKLGAGEVTRLIARYLDTFKTAQPSPREIDSVTAQIALVERLLRKLRRGDRGTGATCTALASLRGAIGGGGSAGQPATAAPAHTPAPRAAPAAGTRATRPTARRGATRRPTRRRGVPRG